MPPVSAPAQDLIDRVHALSWYHSIDLGDGLVTPGLSESVPLRPDELPPLAGKSVLDIGAWDGYYSFLAERQGARLVVALDHYAWGVDIVARNRYWEECATSGTLPDLGRDSTDFWQPDLPGKRGFDLAKELLGSSVEAVVADFATVDLAALGRFDVVFFLGVLYHVEEPLTALQRLRAVTGEVAVIETEAAHLRGYNGESYLRFHAGDELMADFTNWYVPSERALHQMCRAAGFSRTQTLRGEPEPAPPHRIRRSLRRPWRTPPYADLWWRSTPSKSYRAAVRAYA